MAPRSFNKIKAAPLEPIQAQGQCKDRFLLPSDAPPTVENLAEYQNQIRPWQPASRALILPHGANQAALQNMNLEDYQMPIYGTQGGGLAKFLDKDTLVWVIPPTAFREMRVNQEVPIEWDYQPANQRARDVESQY